MTWKPAIISADSHAKPPIAIYVHVDERLYKRLLKIDAPAAREICRRYETRMVPGD